SVPRYSTTSSSHSFTKRSNCVIIGFTFFFSSRRRHTRSKRDWSSDVCSSDLVCLDPARMHWQRLAHAGVSWRGPDIHLTFRLQCVGVVSYGDQITMRNRTRIQITAWHQNHTGVDRKSVV